METETADVENLTATMLGQLVTATTRTYPPEVMDVLTAISANFNLVRDSQGMDTQAAVCEIAEVLNSALDTQTKVKHLKALNMRIVNNSSVVSTPRATLAFRWINRVVRKSLYSSMSLTLFISTYCKLVIEVFTFSTSKLPELAILIGDTSHARLKDDILFELANNQMLVRTLQNYRNSPNIYMALCSSVYQALTQARLTQDQVYAMFFDMVKITTPEEPEEPSSSWIVLKWALHGVMRIVSNNVETEKGGPAVVQTGNTLLAMIKNVNSQEEFIVSVLTFTIVVLFVMLVLKLIEYIVQQQANNARFRILDEEDEIFESVHI